MGSVFDPPNEWSTLLRALNAPELTRQPNPNPLTTLGSTLLHASLPADNPLTPVPTLGSTLLTAGLSAAGILSSTQPYYGGGGLTGDLSVSDILASTPPYYAGGAPATILGALTIAQSQHKWFYVRRRFTQLLTNLKITEWQREAGEKSQARVRACLNRQYYGHSSETDNSMLIGSWGKNTRGLPSSDIDLLYLLPADMYWQFEERVGNRQSQLLQHVKDVLLETYPQTSMRQDGQVVVVPFNTIPIEVAPGFRCRDGSIIVCDTNDEGRYKISTAEAELRELNISDQAFRGNTRALVRFMKRWRSEWNVPLKSFQFERLAIEFMAVWPHQLQDVFYYDWMVRDFLAYLIGRANGYLRMPGTSELVPLGGEWVNLARRAHKHALEACDNERDNYEALAGDQWQKIFGSAAPILVS